MHVTCEIHIRCVLWKKQGWDLSKEPSKEKKLNFLCTAAHNNSNKCLNSLSEKLTELFFHKYPYLQKTTVYKKWQDFFIEKYISDNQYNREYNQFFSFTK